MKSLKSLSEIRQSWYYLRTAGVRGNFLLLSVLASAVVAVLNLYMIRLLFPLVEGILKWDFLAVTKISGPDFFVSLWPEKFSSSTALFALLLIWLYLVILLKSLLSYIGTLLIRRQSLQASIGLRTTLLDRFLSFGKAFFDENPSSRLATQTLRCTGWIERLLSSFHTMLRDSFQLIVYFLVMLVISLPLSASALIVLPLLQLVSSRIISRIQSISKEYNISINKCTQSLHEILSINNLIRCFNKTEAEKRKFFTISRQELSLSQRMNSIRGALDPVLDIAATTGQLCMALTFGWLYTPSSLDTGKAIIFYFLISRIIPLISSLDRFRLSVNSDLGVAGDFDALMNDNDKSKIPEGSVIFNGDFRQIIIRDLRFNYQDKPAILDNLSISIARGEKIAITGETGSGKTTLLNLLIRNYAVSAGMIFIDQTDITDFTIESLRRHIGIVDQDSQLISGSLRENLVYGCDENISEEKLDKVLRSVCMFNAVQKMPNGLDSPVGERAVKLSGGERQRFSIARALLRNSPVLLLDEPSSSLDLVVEGKIMDRLLLNQPDLTVILVTHKPSCLGRFSKIYVLKNGSIDGPFSFEQYQQIKP